MRRFIVDTDIGADADDMVALSYLLGRMRERECLIDAIVLSTARAFAPAATKALLDDFGYGNIPIGKYAGPSLKADSFDHYAQKVAEGRFLKAPDAVTLLRKTLSESDSVDLIGLGPASNISALLDSKPDEHSRLNGRDLIKLKVGKLYLMGGSFECGTEGKESAEWNFAQDVASAQNVLGRFPKEIVLCPFECGAKVLTKATVLKGVARKSFDAFFASVTKEKGNDYSSYSRPSWDPLTAMVALEEDNFYLSDEGEVNLSSDGISSFAPMKGGKRKYLLSANDFSAFEKELNGYLRGLWDF